MVKLLTVDVDPNINEDLKRLAIAVLRGDESAVNPLVDCQLENMKLGPRIVPEYVNLLEDCLHNIKMQLINAEVYWKPSRVLSTTSGYERTRILPDATVGTIQQNIYNLERWARHLNRHGLS